ncbi:Protein of unknown function DUF247, plant [Dillenia turbinata]|uniref:Uncharacterized protein n=1 Tax=Dillenia turbinata TaxID=194707 RepID=A0AAN8VGS8_9MAGN
MECYGNPMLPDERSDSVVIDIENKLSQIHRISAECFIFRIRDQVRKVNEKAYTPEVVAIGPYHHKNSCLQPMEGNKLQYLKLFLQKNKEFSVGRLVKAMRMMEGKARRCYEQPVDLSEDEFVEMMLLDSCFVVELFRRFHSKEEGDCNDPVFIMESIRSSIRRDMVLFENQLPFFVLQAYFDMTKIGDEPNVNLTHMALEFIGHVFPSPDCSPTFPPPLDYEANHLLGLLYNSLIPSIPEQKLKIGRTNIRELIDCSTELQEKGVKFKAANVSSLLNIRFENGVMEVPPLIIDNYTETVFQNLIAYERHCPDGNPRYVSDYIAVMDCLINSTEDVELLRKHGIVENWLSDDQAITNIFNRPADNFIAFGNDCIYAGLFNNVNEYCLRPGTQFKAQWDKWMANLLDNYFNSPWALISLLAATILLALTVAQTLTTEGMSRLCASSSLCFSYEQVDEPSCEGALLHNLLSVRLDIL